MRIAGIAHGSPGRNAKMSVVAKEVLVMATFIPAAVQRTASWTGTVSGKTKYSKRPNADPEHMSGKMYPDANAVFGCERCGHKRLNPSYLS